MKIDQYSKEIIRSRTHAENEINRVLNIVTPEVINILKGYVGLKVSKADFTPLKELNEKLKDILDYKKYAITPLKAGDYASIQFLYISISAYNIKIEISLNFSGGSYEDKTHYCFYDKKAYWLGDNEGQILKSLSEFKPYEFIEVNREIETFYKAKNLKEEFENTLSEFKIYSLKDLIR